MSDEVTIAELKRRLQNFASVRDWEKFHTPRNLVLAMVGEVGELAAELQWLDDHDFIDQDRLARVSEEIADVASYLLRLADVIGISLGEAVMLKIERNENRYPVDRASGSSAKYTAYE